MRCAECKGKGMCGLSRCPIMSRFHARLDLKPASSYSGSAPSLFIGSHGYPQVRGGPLMINDSDNPPQWLAEGRTIDDIVGIRARTIRGTSGIGRYTDNMQEIAISDRPVGVEVAFERPVTFDLTFDGTVAPVGMSGAMKRLEVTGNAHVHRMVDRVTSDTDMSATEACAALAASDIDVYRITQIFSAGLLGRRRTFVPTRWAITAVDDTVSTRLKKEIARNPPIEEIRLFSGEIFGNRIVCILVPGDWKYEMIEIWGRHTLWGGDQDVIVQDREGIVKHGYSPISGAYYSARLAVCEYLHSLRRCARVILIRSVSNEYWAPLGTWVVREAVRLAMANPAKVCPSLDTAVDEASALLGFDHWMPHSSLIPEMRSQKTLAHF
ncbi:MAG: hypothetical protein A4E35_02376 [Methanoregula sp. PtaU1.Bin051]|nr:MAG: hypothetical protein A4E35_02376 [Methanoregula sp. PtaU1.Bin051]